jgi:uncharacterized protein
MPDVTPAAPAAAAPAHSVELTLAAQAHVVALLEQQLGGSPAVQRIETHISFVLVAGQWVYKIKKAVNLGFLDFTTLALRRHFCEEELRLNRRFAPALYVDVVAITCGDGAPGFGGTGAAIDYAVRMRAFAQDALWSRRVESGALRAEDIDRLAQRLCEIHRAAPACAVDSPWGQPAQVRAPVIETLDALETLLRDAADLGRLDTLRCWEAQAFAALRARLARRRDDGNVRECHGDLHLANVAQIDAEPTLFDCLEFDPGLRWTDVLSDVAFLAMDLHHHRRSDLAHRFVNAYLERSGDYEGAAVLRYHLVYRAMVRAKIAALSVGNAGNYLAVASACSRPDGPVLLITHGLSGSGKTSGSGQLLEALGAIRVRSDVERKRLAGLDETARTGSALHEGLYASDHTLATHVRLRQAAACALQGGFNVILDATFLQRESRDQARELARTLGVRFVVLAFHAGVDTLRARVLARQRGGADASEAGLAVLEAQIVQAQPLADDERDDAFDIDAEQPLNSEAMAALAARLRQRLGFAPPTGT